MKRESRLIDKLTLDDPNDSVEAGSNEESDLLSDWDRSELIEVLQGFDNKLFELEWFAEQMNKYVMPGRTDSQDSALLAFKKLSEENKNLKLIIAKEVSENDEFGSEFVLVRILKDEIEELKKELQNGKHNGRTSERIGSDKSEDSSN